RMAVTFDFAIDEATLAAIRPRASRITEVAAERVAIELTQIFSANRFAQATQLLHETHLDKSLALSGAPASPPAQVPYELAMALLVEDPRTFGERWRWSESLIRDVATLKKLQEHHDLI